MSNKELAIKLLDRIPESKMYYIIGILEGAAIPEEEPNTQTIEAFQELENGGGKVFNGSTYDFYENSIYDREYELCFKKYMEMG